MTDSPPAPACVALLKFGTRSGPDPVNRGPAPPRPIPDFGPLREPWPYRGNWPKTGLFAPGTLEHDALILYLDLDVLIVDALDPFFERVERQGGLHELREWNPSLLRLLPVAPRPGRGGQGAVPVWRAREQHHIHTQFKGNREAVPDGSRGDRACAPDCVKTRLYAGCVGGQLQAPLPRLHAPRPRGDHGEAAGLGAGGGVPWRPTPRQAGRGW